MKTSAKKSQKENDADVFNLDGGNYKMQKLASTEEETAQEI